MRYNVHLTAKAESDIDGVLAWFAEQQAIEAGGHWMAQMLAAIDTLEAMPDRCPVAGESAALGLEIRELLVGKRRGTYRVLFQMQAKTVYVLHVRHSARDQAAKDDLS